MQDLQHLCLFLDLFRNAAFACGTVSQSYLLDVLKKLEFAIKRFHDISRVYIKNCISNFLMCKHFGLWTIETQTKCSIIRTYCLDSVKDCSGNYGV